MGVTIVTIALVGGWVRHRHGAGQPRSGVIAIAWGVSPRSLAPHNPQPRQGRHGRGAEHEVEIHFRGVAAPRLTGALAFSFLGLTPQAIL